MFQGNDQIIQVFKRLIEAALLYHDERTVLELITDDVIGIGMGSQGVVSSKADVARVLGDKKEEAVGATTELEYTNLHLRCYDGRFGTVCGTLNIKLHQGGKTVVSTLGQLMNLRLEQGRWLVYTLQATPLFHQIEEMEAYPIKFAENVVETYRQQEQLAKNAQSDSVGVYLVDYTLSRFESSVVASDLIIRTQKGDPYERTLRQAAHNCLREEDQQQFLSAFCQTNVMEKYQSGYTELSMEYEMLLPELPPRWMRTTLKLFTDKTDRHLKGYLYVFDIDETKRRELELQSKAELDSLTGLFHKREAEQKVAQRLRTIGAQDQAAFFMVDLDHFKEINDTYGHQEGDRIIRETAELLRTLSRRSDIAGRVGGDEFCLYLQGDLSLHVIWEKAELLCHGVRRFIPLKQNGTSCSIGIALCSDPATPFQTLYQQADEALYLQKNRGRNGFTIFPGTP